MPRRLFSLIAAMLLLTLLCASLASGAAKRSPAVLDAGKAETAARRANRDAIEGVWGVYQEWDPIPTQAQTYRLAVVRNDYGVFKEAKYLGVVICVKEGVTTGEVKLLLTPTAKKDEFQATWRAAGKEAKGLARLEPDENKTPNAALALHNLKMDGRILVKWLVKNKEG